MNKAILNSEVTVGQLLKLGALVFGIAVAYTTLKLKTDDAMASTVENTLKISKLDKNLNKISNQIATNIEITGYRIDALELKTSEALKKIDKLNDKLQNK